MGRGGYREGAGRKSSGLERLKKMFWVTESEKEKLSQFLLKIRDQDNDEQQEALLNSGSCMPTDPEFENNRRELQVAMIAGKVVDCKKDGKIFVVTTKP